MTAENKISQKEYLKRYLSNDKNEKKRKKKLKIVSSSTSLKRSQVIDDDIDLKNMRVLDDDEVELYQLDEDAPQIAGIIDERPPEVQAMEYYGNKKRWKVFGADDGNGELMIEDSLEKTHVDLKKEKVLKSLDISKLDINDIKNVSKLIKEKNKNYSNNSDLDSLKKLSKYESDCDTSSKKLKKYSSSRDRSKSGSDSDLSPSHRRDRLLKEKHKQTITDRDLSSPIIHREGKNKSKAYDSDLSPPRQLHKSFAKKSSKSSSESDLSPPRRTNKSPPRQFRKNSDSDLSPPRKSSKYAKDKGENNSDSDLSPPRKSDKYMGKSRHHRDVDFTTRNDSRHSLSFRKNNNDSDHDHSPPRRKNYSNDYSNYNQRRDSNYGRYNYHSRNSDKDNRSKDSSKIFNYKKDRRKYDRNESNSDDNNRKGNRHWGSKEKNPYDSHDTGPISNSRDSKRNKMEKTLDGKQAGLQNARQLTKELTDFKEREDKMFSKLSSDMSGRGAVAIMRDRKTGKKRDLEQERLEASQKAEKCDEQNEKYSRWGRGLKQVEEAAERFASAVHEMSKPLARYADDDDLDKMLKAQEREGDPMLDYIRKKQGEAVALTEKKPAYQGSFLPNRFGIRPGYRWDGVDRSSGFEKQWFTTQNNRKARDEEAYKWSVSDM